MDKVLATVDPFKQGDDAPSDSLPDKVWREGCETLIEGWKFAKCALRVESAWTDEALGLLKKGSGWQAVSERPP